jgi:LPS-assembly lipoprotein
MNRRTLLALCIATSAAAGCGFQLRQAPTFAFTSIYINAAAPSSTLANELRRTLTTGSSVTVVPAAAAMTTAQVVLDIPMAQRERVVVGLNTTGQVTELQRRTRLKFKLRTPQGKELIPETELLLQRDVSYSESAALAKEAEEALLYRDMQSDIVQQLMRRLSAIKTL